MLILTTYNRVQIVYYHVCPPSNAWMVYFWLSTLLKVEISWWWALTGGFQADLVVFGAKILRSRWVGSFQIGSRGFSVTNFKHFQVGLIGQLGVIRLFPMFSDLDVVFSAQILSISRWVLWGVMMDNWAWFVYSTKPQEMTADQLSGAAGPI